MQSGPVNSSFIRACVRNQGSSSSCSSSWTRSRSRSSTENPATFCDCELGQQRRLKHFCVARNHPVNPLLLLASICSQIELLPKSKETKDVDKHRANLMFYCRFIIDDACISSSYTVSIFIQNQSDCLPSPFIKTSIRSIICLTFVHYVIIHLITGASTQTCFPACILDRSSFLSVMNQILLVNQNSADVCADNNQLQHRFCDIANSFLQLFALPGTQK